MSMSEWLEDSMEVDEEDINPSVYLRLQPDNQEPDSSFREEDVTATSSSIRSSVFLRNVLRTQSMDESRNYDRVNTRMTRARSIPMVTGDETVATSTAAVNASFDMSMLHHHQLPHASHWHNYQHSSEQSPTTSSAQDLRTLRATASWDEHDSSTTKKRSTKHRAHFAVDMPELPLHSVTKKKRESPVRLRFRPGTTTTSTIKTKGKLTPASGKRHRLRTRSSPLHRLPTTPRAESAALRLLALPAEQHSYYEPATVTKRKPKRSLGTCTTAASSTQLEEETTMDNSTDNSVDTQDTVTNFRFTSFPASLPRIHNNKSNGTIMTTSAGCPNTVRKRMSFGSVTTAALHNNTNNDSHNTSVSSLQHDYFGYSDGDNDDDGDAAIDVGNDEDDPEESAAQSSLQGTPVTRTRLNFNALASSPLAMESKLLDDAEDQEEKLNTDDNKVERSRPYEQKPINSLSKSSIAKNTSACDEMYTAASTSARTPLGGMMGVTHPSVPQTPREVQLHFQLDAAQCSPIRGIPEEEGDSSSRSSAFPSRSRLQFSSPHGSASTAGDSFGRPMPDMNAFDGNNNDTSRSSSSTRSAEDVPSSPKLLCPPTPVRIHPIFRAGGGQKFARSNSLIATKVLATCSPQVLDGRASLENSVLEEGKSDSLSLSADDEMYVSSSTALETGKNAMDWLHHVRSPSLPAIDAHDLNSGNVAAVGPSVSMASTFEVISTLGSGTFADVYKVKSKVDGRLYAIKRNRRQFRGKRDREAALSEVRSMQWLQSHVASFPNTKKANNSLYLLFFFQAWQEDGHFFCQTELCCRDTCREMMDALRSQWNVAKTRYPSLRRLPARDGVIAGTDSDLEGRILPEPVIWKACHDIVSGLSFIHAHGLVHNDIKPSNIFLVKHCRFGALCKIGDFGMARNIGSSDDGQEGDQKYMALELLESGTSHPSADIFSLGLTLYEMASNLQFTVPSDGSRWHDLRRGQHALEFPADRSTELAQLVRATIELDRDKRPLADTILSVSTVTAAGKAHNHFLSDYIQDVEEFEKREEETTFGYHDEQTPRNATRRLCSPPAKLPAPPMLLYSPEAAPS